MVNPSPFRHLPVSRRTLLGGLLGASALTLAGCSGSDQPAAEAPAPSSTEILGRTDLEVLAWTNGPTIDDNFKKRVEQFNTEMAGKFTAKINFLPAHPKVAPDPDLAAVVQCHQIRAPSGWQRQFADAGKSQRP